MGRPLFEGSSPTGHTGLLVRSPRTELDLAAAKSRSKRFFEQERPEYVFLAAARVGGIRERYVRRGLHPRQPAHTDQRHRGGQSDSGVEKLVFLGSSCIYPRLAPQPIKEESATTGALEPTNQAVRGGQDRRHRNESARIVVSSASALASA